MSSKAAGGNWRYSLRSRKPTVRTANTGSRGRRSNALRLWNCCDRPLMATTIRLHRDFKEFLRLLQANEVEYLLVGGYAVGFHGYPRPTGNLDVWVSRSRANADKLVTVLAEFGFVSEKLIPELFLANKSIVRMGVQPYKLEVINYIDGVDFETCYPKRIESEIDGVMVKVIDLANLKKNKAASGRAKDINDLENLP